MKAPAFDAVLDFPLGAAGREVRAEAVFLGGAVAARFLDYAVARPEEGPVRPRHDGPSGRRPMGGPLRGPDGVGRHPRPRQVPLTRTRPPPRSSSCPGAKPCWPGWPSARRT